MNITIVTAAIIKKDNKILIAQRNPGKHEEYKWEFPGGKLEPGESPKECLRREIKEELNINIEVNDVFEVVYHEYSSINILLVAYECIFKSGPVKTLDCNDFKWINLDEINNYTFADADIPIIHKMLNKKRL